MTDTPTHGIAVATALTAVGDGRWEGVLDEAWSIGGRPNGGYLMAAMAAAASAETGRDLPLGITAVFTQPPAFGPVVMAVETIRSGRTVSAVRVRVEQSGTSCAEALISIGDATA